MNLFIDITELATWKGHLTGVPRVMNEIASRYVSHDSVQFVQWDGLAQKYVEATVPQFVPNEAVASEVLEIKKTALVKKVVKKAAKSNVVTRKVAYRARSLRQQLQQSKQATTTPLGEVRIEKGDTLFILADWHGSDQNFIDKLLELEGKGVKLVQVCHDLIPLVTPQYSGHSTNTLATYVSQIYPVCSLVLANSENTKRDMAAWLSAQKLKTPKTEVFRLGDDFKRKKAVKPADEKFLKAFSKSSKYILCVGTIEARKNHTLLYYTAKLAKSRGIELPPVVIVCRRGWKTEEIYAIMNTDPEVSAQFIFLENCSDEELSWLYEHCQFSVYASFYEGWGLPIAESMAYGVPCIASNTSSMVEVAGDLIGYFSPASSDECLAAITDLLQGDNLAAARKKVKAYKPVTWDATFEQVNNQIGGVINE